MVSRVISVMLPDLQELTPIHSSELPVSREGDTQRDKCSPKRTGTQLHIWSVTGCAVGFSTDKNQPVYSLTAFSMTVVNELWDISNVELYNQLIGQFEPAQYIF